MPQIVPFFYRNFQIDFTSVTFCLDVISYYIDTTVNTTEYITVLNKLLSDYSTIYISIFFLLLILIFLGLAMGRGTPVKPDYDTVVYVGIALVVCFLLSAAFLGNDLIIIRLSCEPLYSEPGYMEILRVFFSSTYDLHIISTTVPYNHIEIPNMPAALLSFSDANGHPALQLLVFEFAKLYDMLVQLDISFHNRMVAPETYRDELELNKLKTVLNHIYKIQAILIYYIPSFPGLDLAQFA